MSDSNCNAPPNVTQERTFFASNWRQNRSSYVRFKRIFDIVISAAILAPIGLMVGCGLLLINPIFNRGSLFFTQERMGYKCRPFRAWKFRTMVDVPFVERGAFDSLEHHRITSLGRFLRKSRLDELPQIINVLRGEMSLIGPRPDYLPHALVYIEEVPGYRQRFVVLPGISGYAQICHGYIDGEEGVFHKVKSDLYYIENSSVRLDFWIAWQTALGVVLRKGK